MSQSSTLYGGFDVHNESIAVAYTVQAHGAEGTYLGTMGSRQCDIDNLLRKMPSKATPLVLVYEAGPCGAWLDRYFIQKGHNGWGGAPSLIPKKAGARIQPDRRDAVPRARLRRSGDLPPGAMPQEADDARRERTRAREDVIGDLQAATLRLNAFWLRHDSRYPGRATWNPAPLRWLSAVVCTTPAPPLVVQEDVRAVHEHTERRHRLDQALQAPVQTWRFNPGVEALQALRGVHLTVAVTTVAELGDLTRFNTPKELTQCLGRTPSEDASGERRRQGAIPKAGNTHARRVLGEGAWASRAPAQGSRPLQLRLARQPTRSQAISGKAQGRLCTRYRRLMARGKPAKQVVVAGAREVGGCMWAIAKRVPVTA